MATATKVKSAVEEPVDLDELRRNQLVSKLLNLSHSIDKLHELREQKRELEAKLKTIESDMDIVTEHLLGQMDKQGMEKASSSKATASISSSTVANVLDWDAFYTFIKKKNYFHLLQRRVSDKAYVELLEQKVKVPGVQPFSKRRLNLRAL